MNSSKISPYQCHLTHAIGSFSVSASSKKEVLATLFAFEIYVFPSQIFHIKQEEFNKYCVYLKSQNYNFVDFMEDEFLSSNLHKMDCDCVYVEEYILSKEMIQNWYFQNDTFSNMHELFRLFEYSRLDFMMQSLSFIPWENLDDVLHVLIKDPLIDDFHEFPENAWAYYQTQYLEHHLNGDATIIF